MNFVRALFISMKTKKADTINIRIFSTKNKISMFFIDGSSKFLLLVRIREIIGTTKTMIAISTVNIHSSVLTFLGVNNN